MLFSDILTFMCDFIMVIKRNWMFASLRFITCSVAITLGAMVQVEFILHSYNGGDLSLDFKRSLHAWIFGIMIYIYQCYIVWGVINILMYNQIIEDDRKRKNK